MKLLKTVLAIISLIMISTSTKAQFSVMSYGQQFITSEVVTQKSETVKFLISQGQGPIVVMRPSETTKLSIVKILNSDPHLLSFYCIDQNKEPLIVDMFYDKDDILIQEIVLYKVNGAGENEIQNYKIEN